MKNFFSPEYTMTEKELKLHVCKILDSYKMAGRLYYIRLNAGAMPASYTDKKGIFRKRLIRLAPPGTADLVIFFKRGKAIFIELKTEKGVQSPAQKEFQEKLEALQYEYFIIRSISEFWNFLDMRLTA